MQPVEIAPVPPGRTRFRRAMNILSGVVGLGGGIAAAAFAGRPNLSVGEVIIWAVICGLIAAGGFYLWVGIAGSDEAQRLP